MSRAVATLHIITYSKGDQKEYNERCWGHDLVTLLCKVVEEGKLERKDRHRGAGQVLLPRFFSCCGSNREKI